MHHGLARDGECNSICITTHQDWSRCSKKLVVVLCDAHGVDGVPLKEANTYRRGVVTMEKRFFRATPLRSAVGIYTGI